MKERIARLLAVAGERLADMVRASAHGTVLDTPSLPSVWDLNLLRVESTDATASEVADEADRAQAGFAHRKVMTYSELLGPALAPGLRERGYTAERTLIMLHRGPVPEASPGAVELSLEQVAPMLEAFRRTRPYADRDDVIAQLADMDARNTRELGARDFCAPAGGLPLAGCRLFAIEGAGQIEHVGTLPDARGRGLARAAVLAAMAAAQADGLRPLFILAEADDWPHRWYARLGFETVGLFHEFTRPPDGARP
jgi:GNAT superfamily N-acetyltransferase